MAAVAFLSIGRAEATAARTPYRTIAADDWKGYHNKDELKQAEGFWWFRKGDVYQFVDLAKDATFGQVVRVTFPRTDSIGFAPKYSRKFKPLEKMWFRWRMKYSPGFTTSGPLPPGHANSYKVAFWLWSHYEGRGSIEISNTTQYFAGMGVKVPGGDWVRYQERPLPGSTSFGQVTTEWTDGEWWEFVVYYNKTGPNSARQYHWRRRLTTRSAVTAQPFVFTGFEVTGGPTPLVSGIRLGETKNKNNPSTMHIYWGPWEVVDGTAYPNPFQMPNLGL